MTYHLSVVKNLALIDYDHCLKVYRELQSLMAKHRLIHGELRDAKIAARFISTHPLVTSVTITRETPVAIWQNGRKI